MEPIERAFWSKVDRSRLGPGGCWEWTASRFERGYGQFKHPSSTRAHRVSYELSYGPVPDGLKVLHRCDNPPCVNPAHLYTGTNSDNMTDRSRRGRLDGLARGQRHGSHTMPERRARGSRHGRSVLSESQVRDIRARFAAGKTSQSSIAREYNVHPQTVCDIIRRKHWTHI